MNWLFLGLSVAVGFISAMIGVQINKAKRNPWLAVMFTALTGVVLSIVSLPLLVLFGANQFGLVHVVYLIITVGAPLAAAILLFKIKPKSVARWVMIACLLPGLIGIYASHIEPFWLRIDRQQLPAAEIVADVRIAVLSDLQTTRIGSYEQRALDSLASQNADIILIPGDFYQLSSQEFIDRKAEFADAMRQIGEMTEHVYVVDGDADSIDELQQLIAGSSVQLLDNQLASFEVNGLEVNIAGLSLKGEAAKADLLRQISDLDQPEVLSVVLAHRPEDVYLLPNPGSVDLLVAGHTHGGQVSIPFFGPPVTLTTVPRDVAAGGLHDLDGQQIYVSTGVGRERGQAPQLRFGVRPSIGVIDINR